MKKVITMVLVLAMVLSLAVPTFAATDYTLTINNTVDGHTNEAYQIFTGDLVTKDGRDVLSNIVWGSAVANPAGLLAAINADAKLSALHGAADAAALAVKLSAVTSDSETIDQFAEVVAPFLTVVAGTSTDEGDCYEISGLVAGYYLVKDQDDTLDNKNDVYTKYIIRVLKDQTVTPKGDVPSVDKEINDTVDGTFNEVEDFDISDTAYYKWTATFPSNLKSYEKYIYQFTDNLPKGLKFTRFEQIYIEGHDGNRVHTFYDVTDADPANDTLPAGISTNLVENGDMTSVLTLNFADLLTLYPSILPTHKLIVKYSCMVTRDALFVNAMTNTVSAKFSNNPNGTGDGDLGETPDDVAHAFTFKINVDKYDADNAATKLEGAEFVLYYERTVADSTVKYYAQVVTEEMVYVVDGDGNVTSTLRPEAERMLNGTPVDGDDIGVVYGWTDVRANASILDTDATGKLAVRGLDEGIYYLQETKAPAGYNLMETPVQIKIVPKYTVAGNTASVEVSYEVDSIAQASDTVGVRNSSGSTLPVTGGIGTTLFYVFGSVMVLAAVVLLITKKRMTAET